MSSASDLADAWAYYVNGLIEVQMRAVESDIEHRWAHIVDTVWAANRQALLHEIRWKFLQLEFELQMRKPPKRVGVDYASGPDRMAVTVFRDGRPWFGSTSGYPRYEG